MKKVYEYQSSDGSIFFSSAKKAFERAKECEPVYVPTYKKYLRDLKICGGIDLNPNEETAIVIREIL